MRDRKRDFGLRSQRSRVQIPPRSPGNNHAKAVLFSAPLEHGSEGASRSPPRPGSLDCGARRRSEPEPPWNTKCSGEAFRFQVPVEVDLPSGQGFQVSPR